MSTTLHTPHCKIVVRVFDGEPEILADAGHQDGPIWLAIGTQQIHLLLDRLQKAIAEIKP
jgi:hypothetical protein